MIDYSVLYQSPNYEKVKKASDRVLTMTTILVFNVKDNPYLISKDELDYNKAQPFSYFELYSDELYVDTIEGDTGNKNLDISNLAVNKNRLSKSLDDVYRDFRYVLYLTDTRVTKPKKNLSLPVYYVCTSNFTYLENLGGSTVQKAIYSKLGECFIVDVGEEQWIGVFSQSEKSLKIEKDEVKELLNDYISKSSLDNVVEVV